MPFIDHNSRTLLNGSALGKEFSANALSTRFADFPAGGNLRPIMPATTNEGLLSTMRSASNKRQQAISSATPDLSFVGDATGSLLSILTRPKSAFEVGARGRRPT